MNVQYIQGRRPTLSAVYAGIRGRPPIERHPTMLSGSELRRIVADFVD